MSREEFDGLINALERITEFAEERELNNFYELINDEYNRSQYKLSEEDCNHISQRLEDASDLIDVRIIKEKTDQSSNNN